MKQCLHHLCGVPSSGKPRLCCRLDQSVPAKLRVARGHQIHRKSRVEIAMLLDCSWCCLHVLSELYVSKCRDREFLRVLRLAGPLVASKARHIFHYVLSTGSMLVGCCICGLCAGWCVLFAAVQCCSTTHHTSWMCARLCACVVCRCVHPLLMVRSNCLCVHHM